MIKLRSRKPILDAFHFTVFEEELEVKTGDIHTYKSVIRKPSVSVFPLTDTNEIYLIKQYRYLHDMWLFEAVAGMVDDGEDHLVAAKRELKEETGIVAKEWILLATPLAAGSIITWQQSLYIAQDLELQEAELEDSEEIELVKIPFDEAVDKVISGEIKTYATLFGILMIDKLRQEGKI